MASHTDNNGALHVSNPQPNDVLMGRGTTYANHPGNMLYTDLVQTRSKRYCDNRPPLEKKSLLEDLVEQILNQGGRFLQRNDSNDHWVVVSKRRAMTKAAHAMHYLQRTYTLPFAKSLIGPCQNRMHSTPDGAVARHERMQRMLEDALLPPPALNDCIRLKMACTEAAIAVAAQPKLRPHEVAQMAVAVYSKSTDRRRIHDGQTTEVVAKQSDLSRPIPHTAKPETSHIGSEKSSNTACLFGGKTYHELDDVSPFPLTMDGMMERPSSPTPKGVHCVSATTSTSGDGPMFDHEHTTSDHDELDATSVTSISSIAFIESGIELDGFCWTDMPW